MATKNDLIEAQSFSRRRLLTAFVSGAPGGKELVPAAPLRAVVAAVALTAAVILAGVFYGIVRPGLPNGWQNGRLVLAEDTGGRYVTVDGELHPVLNIASARLLIPSSDFAIITTDQKTLDAQRLGPTVGIVGAPDELPAPANLVNSGWTACATDDSGVDVRVGGDSHVDVTTDAAVVESGGIRYVIDGDLRFEVFPQRSDDILRLLGFTSLDPTPVSAAWLNLFAQGSELKPLVIGNAGQPAPNDPRLRIGEVFHETGTPEDQRYVITEEGTLAALSPLAWQLLRWGSPETTVQDVPASTLSGVQTASSPAGARDWPAGQVTPIGDTERACAVLTHPNGSADTVLGEQADTVGARDVVVVAAGAGALVRAGGAGDQSTTMLTLIDSTGTAYALPGADDETVRRLGYAPKDEGTASQDWVRLFAAGPALTEKAAGETHSAGSR